MFLPGYEFNSRQSFSPLILFQGLPCHVICCLERNIKTHKETTQSQKRKYPYMEYLLFQKNIGHISNRKWKGTALHLFKESLYLLSAYSYYHIFHHDSYSHLIGYIKLYEIFYIGMQLHWLREFYYFGRHGRCRLTCKLS